MKRFNVSWIFFFAAAVSLFVGIVIPLLKRRFESVNITFLCVGIVQLILGMATAAKARKG